MSWINRMRHSQLSSSTSNSASEAVAASGNVFCCPLSKALPWTGEVIAICGGVLHVLHGACGTEGLSSGANELLDFDAISRAVAAGARLVDFGASDPADEGLRAYKRKFGSEERVASVGVMHLRPIRSRLADLARTIAGTRIGGGLLALSRPRR